MLFFLQLNHLPVLKGRFLKKILFKKSENPSPFFFFLLQEYRLKQFFYSNWKQFQVFKIVNFEFKVTVY